MANIPDKPTLDGIEARWADQWDADATYRFDASVARWNIDSPANKPPICTPYSPPASSSSPGSRISIEWAQPKG